MSDDENDDVVVMRVCARNGCVAMEDLEFDEETGEMYCASCRELFARAAKEGFHVLLSHEDLNTVELIFDAFDKGHKDHWTFEDFNLFQDAIEKCDGGPLETSEALASYFREEFDITLKHTDDNGAAVVTRMDVEDMYGGYAYNNLPALTEDAEHLSEAGFINLSVLE
eukprot:CAMPEP_0176406474 /NCGR_PEP_ID=MMETSP0127-20121128/892_1 /TAXON_ID=938130 /ORGANISM="Platyophrya macrostoma, Strain WH" /LENGTH=167 /DNA_ID=CAMNT_0017785605 /DNA_START=52 /DNA_END=555 /DNA_ORIENTATION=-